MDTILLDSVSSPQIDAGLGPRGPPKSGPTKIAFLTEPNISIVLRSAQPRQAQIIRRHVINTFSLKKNTHWCSDDHARSDKLSSIDAPKLTIGRPVAAEIGSSPA